MTGVASTANVPAIPLLLSLLTITAVFGCAAGPAAMSTRTFIITGFSLPAQMVFSTGAGVAAQVAGIAPSADAARGFVMRVIMQAVFDVLEQQGRAAGLSDPIIQIILSQLTVNIVYQPLECNTVGVNPMPADNIMVMDNKPACVIIGNTVTAICNMACMINMPANLMGIPASATTISGTLTTTNPIMANWSTEMWKGVVNRVIRALQLGPLGTNFFSASATVQ